MPKIVKNNPITGARCGGRTGAHEEWLTFFRELEPNDRIVCADDKEFKRAIYYANTLMKHQYKGCKSELSVGLDPKTAIPNDGFLFTNTHRLDKPTIKVMFRKSSN